MVAKTALIGTCGTMSLVHVFYQKVLMRETLVALFTLVGFLQINLYYLMAS
jgi:hypothetical protein